MDIGRVDMLVARCCFVLVSGICGQAVRKCALLAAASLLSADVGQPFAARFMLYRQRINDRRW
jgi:hypothetical protein